MTAAEIRKSMDQVLTSLPPAHVLGSQAESRLVVGPTGAFVLAAGRPRAAELQAAAYLLDGLTATTREALCQHLVLVPFIDSIVVTDGDVASSVTTAALDLLRDVLTEGPKVIDPATLVTIRDAVRRSTLNGWRPGLPSGSDKIDLCDPVEPSTSR